MIHRRKARRQLRQPPAREFAIASIAFMSLRYASAQACRRASSPRGSGKRAQTSEPGRRAAGRHFAAIEARVVVARQLVRARDARGHRARLRLRALLVALEGALEREDRPGALARDHAARRKGAPIAHAVDLVAHGLRELAAEDEVGVQRVDAVLDAHRLRRGPQRLRDDEPAVDAAPRIVRALGEVGIGAVRLEAEHAREIEGRLALHGRGKLGTFPANGAARTAPRSASATSAPSGSSAGTIWCGAARAAASARGVMSLRRSIRRRSRPVLLRSKWSSERARPGVIALLFGQRFARLDRAAREHVRELARERGERVAARRLVHAQHQAVAHVPARVVVAVEARDLGDCVLHRSVTRNNATSSGAISSRPSRCSSTYCAQSRQ